MQKIFTKTFLGLSPDDRWAVVTSILTDIAGSIGRHLDPNDDKRAERRRKRIVGRALREVQS